MKIEHTYIVYIVECKDWSYYLGITNDLEKRLWEHNTGQDEDSYTYSRRPVVLKYFETFTDVNQAIAREKQLKGWSRKKKQALIAQNFDKLKELSKPKSDTKLTNDSNKGLSGRACRNLMIFCANAQQPFGKLRVTKPNNPGSQALKYFNSFY